MGAAEAPIVVEAQTLERAPDGTLTASDNVRVAFPEGDWTSESASLRPDGTLRMDDVAGVVSGYRFRAGTLERSAYGALMATDLRLAPCDCDDGSPPLLHLEAERGQLDGDALRLERVRARVGSVRSPAFPQLRTSIDPHRWRFLLPELGATERGADLLVGVRGRAFDGDASVQAGWRGGIGPMANVTLSPEAGRVHILGGWDVARADSRGAAQAQLALGSTSQAVLDVDIATDADVARDLGGDVDARMLPWRDSRVLLQSGPLRVDGRIGDDGSHATLARARLRRDARVQQHGRSADASVWLEGRLDALDAAALEPEGWPRTGEVTPAARAGGTLETEATLGPTRAAARAFVASGTHRADAPDAVATASWTMRAWRASQGGLLRVEPGLELNAVTVRGPATVMAGPRIAASWRNGRSAFSADGTVAMTSRAPTLITAGRLRMEHGPIHVAATHDPLGTQASVALGGDGLGVRAGYVHARRADVGADDALLSFAGGWAPWLRASGDDLALAEAGASISHARWMADVSVSVRADDAPAFQGARATAGYDDGCVAVVLRGGYARLDDGRALVDATLSLTLRPPSSAP